MSNRNNSQVDPGVILGMVFVVFIGIILMAVAALAAAVMTILCIAAWNTPVTIGAMTITSKEARWFVYRGCIGAVVVPFIVVLVVGPLSPEQGYGPNAPLYVMAAGYTIGSLGVEYILFKLQEPQQVHDVTPETAAAPAAPPAAPKLTPLPFNYANWDDGERK